MSFENAAVPIKTAPTVPIAVQIVLVLGEFAWARTLFAWLDTHAVSAPILTIDHNHSHAIGVALR